MKNISKLDKSNIQDIVALSPMQEGMLFHYLQNPNSSEYFEQLSLTLVGKVNSEFVKEAWNFIAQSNEMLRTIFRWEKLEKPIQIVLKEYEIPVVEYDISMEDSKSKNQLLYEIKEQDKNKGIDISVEPLRVLLVKLDGNKYEMIISNHHILYDGWSNGIILKEFFTAYNSFFNNIQPIYKSKGKFKEFIKWYQNQDKEKQLRYWSSYLDDFETKNVLPAGNVISSSHSNQCGMSSKLSKELAEKIDRLCKQEKITMAAFMYTAWGILLQKYSNTDDAVFGTTVSGRKANVRGIEDIVGLFINTIPLRIKNDKHKTIRSMFMDVDKMLKDREEYENTSLVDIKTASGFDYQSNIFDSIVVLENYPLDKTLNNSNSVIKIESYSMYEATNFDLVLSISAFEDVEMNFIYNSDSFDKAVIEKMMEHFEHIIKSIIQNPIAIPSEIDMFSKAEKDKIIFEFNNTNTQYPKYKTLHGMFEEQVEKTPDNIAVSFKDEYLTYKELNIKANQLASILRSKGVKPDSIVAMIVDRSLDMIVGIMAILKAGGAYLPIDPTYPEDRIDYMLKDSGTDLLITQSFLVDKVKFDGTIVDILDGNNYVGEGVNLEHINKSSDLAYVIYTSGSTGKPKGNLTMHYNVTRVVKDTNYIEITDKDVVLQLSNYAFDGSVFDIYGALLNGAKLILVDRETVIDMYKLSALIIEKNISIFFITTALFNTIVDLNIECLKNVRRVLFGGERVSLQHAKKALEYMGRDRIIHVYGPTESTVFATYYYINEIDEKLGTVPIGGPLANTKLYVLDKECNIMPIGAAGELCISGDGLARGYFNRPELTLEKFVKSPFVPGEIMYKTGDLVRLLPDGAIEFIGRIDKQVKIRGFRIELGEIESLILNYEDVKEAVAVTKQDNTGNHYICAYMAADSEISVTNIKEYLLKELPEYMVPSYFMQIDKLPLTLNGKVDRKVLEQQELIRVDEIEYEEPTNEIEERLSHIWKQVLGVEKVGINNNFFELGGHSLKATNAVSKIYKELGVQVPLKQFFALATIKQLALYIKDQEKVLYPVIKAIESKEYYEVSCSQKAMFLQQQFDGVGISYNMPIVMMVDGKINMEKLNKAFKELIKRHESLRTSFMFVEEKLCQRIHNDIEFNILRIESDEKNIDETICQFIKPFNLNEAPLIRVGIKQLSEQRHILMMDMHHIISDGLSVNILLKELTNIYEGRTLEPLKLHYKDYAEWQVELFKSDYMKKQENYWKSQLLDEVPVLNMTADFKRLDNRTFEGDTVKFKISSHLIDGLNQIAQNNNTTLNTILCSIYTILLSKYTSQQDIVIGTLAAGRTYAEIQNTVGMFNNFLPIRNKINVENSFAGFVNSVKEIMLDAYENQDYPYDKMVENFARRNDLSRNPLFDTMLILHNQLEAGDIFKSQDLTFRRYDYENKTSKLDFKLDAFIDEINDLSCILEFNSSLYKRNTMEKFSSHFVNIVKEVVENPYKKLCQIQMIDNEEKKLILERFNNTKADYQRDKTLYQLFEEKAEECPDRIAAVYGEESITYRELNKKSNQLARVLREKGVKSDSIVALSLYRSIEMEIGIMAVQKAGGAYLPISPDYPEDRIKYMMEDSQAKLLLTDANLKAKYNFENVDVIALEDEKLYTGEDYNLQPISGPKNLAYVIYTSGSTGKPKGAMIEHHSAINRIKWMQKKYPIGEKDVILQKTPYTFDVSVWELFWWSMEGAKVCFLTPGGEKDPEEIVKAIEKHRVTTLHFVPSMLNIFLEYAEGREDLGRLSSLKQVFSSGEALTVPQVERFNRILNSSIGAKLINLYGPTEATVDVSYFDCSTGEKFEIIPIGKPIDNIKLLVVDKYNNLLPVGVPGELCISGVGVGRGYLNRPELTAEKFIENPHVSGERMYRTGDLVRWISDGNIEFLGRLDHQVKIRGFRIELGEIENELLKHSEIKEALVLDKVDKNGNKYLCGYIVAERELTVSELKEHLMKNLPDYMVPAYFITLDKMPLSANGKADRKALPEPEGSINTGVEYAAPENETEEKLVSIWQELLQLDKIGVNDNFFELGGHSLKAAVLAGKIHKHLNVEITLTKIFKNPTIKELAEQIKNSSENIYSSIKPVESREYHPISSAQKRIFILNKIEAASTNYNLPMAMVVEGELEKERFDETFKKLIQRHESLRTSFDFIDGEPVQIIHDEVDFTVDYRESAEDKLELELKQFIRPFDLNKAPLLRVGLIRTEPNKHILVFDMHHIISDGVSMVVLVQEFVELYKGNDLPELRIQYKDFASWQNDLLNSEIVNRQKEYWLDLYKNDIPVLNMPTDYPRPSMQSFEGDKISIELNQDLVERLRKVALNTGTTLYMQLLAVYNVLLSKYTGQEDIIVGSPVGGRPHPDLENLIGMFVNTLAMRNYPTGEKTFNEFLGEVKKNSLNAFENQEYQFEQLIEELKLEKDFSRNPLFDTMIVLQNMSVPEMNIDKLTFRSYKFENKVSKFDITLEVIERTEKIIINIEYCTKLYRKSTIEKLASHFVNIVKEVVDNPYKKLSQIQMIDDEEKKLILGEFNNTKADYESSKTLYQLFEKKAEEYPDRIAAVYGEESITYRELNKKANQLARILRGKGVKADSIVALSLYRSIEMAVGIMAVQKAGGAYLPISPDYPEDRIRYMLEDSKAQVLLTQCNFEERYDFENLEVVAVDDEKLYTGDSDNLQPVSGPNNLAYVIYTSGSTGKPKGAMIEHHSAINRIKWMQKKYPIGEKDVILQKTPYTFDVSVWELFWWSMEGAKVCFLTPGGEKDPEEIVKAIEKHKVTTLHFVPSMLNIFLEYAEGREDLGRLSSLKQVFSSGEALTVPQVERFNNILNNSIGAKLINLYGPTEATVDVSYFDCSTGEKFEIIPIGKPIDNIKLLVVDKYNNLLPVGVPGELCISGVGVGRGYLNRPELTAEKFIENPHVSGERMYRTGDLVRWISDGNIEFLGRLDHQVKIRGFRIELGEIENELLKHSAIKEALVLDKADKNGNKYLCGYIVAERELTVSELKEHLMKNLPDYMVPAYFITLDKMPLSANGKADRKALPEPEGSINTGVEYAAPENEIEEKLVCIWQELLQLEKVGVNDNFFDLGGNSLSVVKMHEKIEKQNIGEIKVTDIFANPTISKLAEFIKKINCSDMEQIKIKHLTLPQEYFGSSSMNLMVFKFKLADLNSLKEISIKENVEVKDILLSSYAYLLSQISGNKDITIQTMLEDSEYITQISINLEKIENFSSLFKYVNEQRKYNSLDSKYSIKDSGDINLNKGPLDITPFIYIKELLGANQDLNCIYDLVFEISEEGNSVQFKCEFNGRKLREDKMQGLINGYLKLNKLIISSY